MKIFGRKFKLVYKKGDHADLHDCLGSCDTKKAEIFVQEDLPEREQLSVLFHEMLHAIWPEEGEEMINMRARLIFEVLWENDMIGFPK